MNNNQHELVYFCSVSVMSQSLLLRGTLSGVVRRRDVYGRLFAPTRHLATTSLRRNESKVSTSPASSELVLPSSIPDRPTPLESLPVDTIEPTLSSLGLATWWPSGRVQYVMEWLHVDVGLPWYACILATTVTMRLLVFPLVVRSQRNAAMLANNSPKLQALQSKMSDARRRGDLYEASKLGHEMHEFMNTHAMNPLKNMLPMAIQLPIFMSFFFGLRGMANLPVESLSTGGTLWFHDLTLADPYYILPLCTSASLYLQFKFAADGANLQQMGPIMRGVMRAMPLALFPLTMNFSSAITFYWLTTNIISVLQARLVRIEMIRSRLGIPKIIKRSSQEKMKEKGFVEGVREAIDNWKVQSDITDRRAYDEQMFREAGVSRVRRTYRFDPTKPYLRNK